MTSDLCQEAALLWKYSRASCGKAEGTFEFNRFSGVLSFDLARPEKSTVEFVVEAASARCVDDWVRPAQIKDIEKAAIDDTMAAATYTRITFQSTRITVRSADLYEVQGLLTIRGQARPVTLNVR